MMKRLHTLLSISSLRDKYTEAAAKSVQPLAATGTHQSFLYVFVHIAKSGGSTVVDRMNYLAGGILRTCRPSTFSA
jgi:hypothetical protein